MLIIAFGIFCVGAITVLAAESRFRESKVLKFNDHSQKTFEPAYEQPVFRRTCGYLIGGNSWKK
jgi:hypothetical protein